MTTLGISYFLCAAGSSWGASVQSFGATGNGQTDDTAAIQTAINATTSGTLTFPAGTYKISRTLNGRSGVTYAGQGKAVITGTYGQPILALPWNAVNVNVTGLTFDDGQLLVNGNVSTNIMISGNTFQNLTILSGNWTVGNAIFAGALRNSSIDHNTFTNILPNGSTRPGGQIDNTNVAIFVYGLDQTNVDYNTFNNVGEGIRFCFSQTFPTSNVHVGNNTMTHIHRMGMEMQDALGCGASSPAVNGPATNNLVIENNSISDWLDPYWNSFGISEAMPAPWGANGVIIRNNLIVATQSSYGGAAFSPSFPYGYGIEAGGAGLQIYGNVIAGYYWQSITVAPGSAGAQVHDNYACALDPGAPVGVGDELAPNPGAQYYNNTILSSCPAVLPNPG